MVAEGSSRAGRAALIHSPSCAYTGKAVGGLPWPALPALDGADHHRPTLNGRDGKTIRCRVDPQLLGAADGTTTSECVAIASPDQARSGDDLHPAEVIRAHSLRVDHRVTDVTS